MVKEKTLVIGFLTLVILLSFIFLLIKVSKHGEPIDWDYDDDGSGSSSSSTEESDELGATMKPPKCVDSSPETSTEETDLTTPGPDTGESGKTASCDIIYYTISREIFMCKILFIAGGD